SASAPPPTSTSSPRTRRRCSSSIRRPPASAGRAGPSTGRSPPPRMPTAAASFSPAASRPPTSPPRAPRGTPSASLSPEAPRARAGHQSPRPRAPLRRRRQGIDPMIGRSGPYGGRYVAETLMPALDELGRAWTAAADDRGFQAELDALLHDYVGRPSGLYHARALSAAVGARVYLKREDLNHTGAHKINNCIGQALLARRMGKKRLIAETGAGQHGVATATVAALLGFRCEIYMGHEDVERQALNVFRMRLLGATVHSVDQGTRTLKDAMNEA